MSAGRVLPSRHGARCPWAFARAFPVTRHVYALRIPGTHLTKIGVSWRPPYRATSYRRVLRKVGLTCVLICSCNVPGDGFTYERALHWHFRAYQIHGEWFSIPPARVVPPFTEPVLYALYLQAGGAGVLHPHWRYDLCTCGQQHAMPWRAPEQLALLPDVQEAS